MSWDRAQFLSTEIGTEKKNNLVSANLATNQGIQSLNPKTVCFNKD